jgi:hypothetical protein
MHYDFAWNQRSNVEPIAQLIEPLNAVFGVDVFILTLLENWEFNFASNFIGDTLDHLRCLFVLSLRLRLDQSRHLHTEVNDSVSLGFSLERLIDTMSCSVVSDSFLVSF